MKKLRLAWQEPKTRMWYIVGSLIEDTEKKEFIFSYENVDLVEKLGFHPVSSFLSFKKEYRSNKLFPFFENRVLSRGRKDFNEYLKTLGLKNGSCESDFLDILSVTGGERQTDNFAVVPEVEPNSKGEFSIRFFLHGVRHLSTECFSLVENTLEGERLKILEDHSNKADKPAFQVQTEKLCVLGWIPRYIRLVLDLNDIKCAELKLIMNNKDVPLSRKFLVELSGKIQS